MAQLILEITEDLARHLEELATAQNKSVEQVALEHLRSRDNAAGSPNAILRAMKQQPNVSSAATDEMETAIRNARLAVEERGAFEK